MPSKSDKIITSVNFQNTILIVLVVGCVLFSLPTLAIFCIFYFLYLCKNPDSKTIRYSIYAFLAFLMGYLNTSKPYDFSDIGYYYWLYNFTGTQSFTQFLALIPKEPLFHIYTYLMHFLTFGNFNLYLIVTTIIMYMLVFVSFDIVCRNNDVDIRYALLASVILLMFSEFFFYTAQIVRQVLAGSLAIYGITKTTFERDRLSIWLIALSGLIHASAFFFSIYYIIYFFRKYPLKYLIGATLLAVVFYGVLLRFMGGFMDADSTLGMAMRRGTSDAIESYSVGMLPILICFSVIPMSVFIMIKSRDLNLNLWLIMPILLMVFILVNINKPLFVLRFMEYVYMYIPITLTLSVIYLSRKNSRILLTVIAILMMLRFSLKLGSSNFSFLDVPQFIMSGLPKILFMIF